MIDCKRGAGMQEPNPRGLARFCYLRTVPSKLLSFRQRSAFASYSYVSFFVKMTCFTRQKVEFRAMMTSRLMHTVAPAFHAHAERLGSDELHEQNPCP